MQSRSGKTYSRHWKLFYWQRYFMSFHRTFSCTLSCNYFLYFTLRFNYLLDIRSVLLVFFWCICCSVILWQGSSFLCFLDPVVLIWYVLCSILIENYSSMSYINYSSSIYDNRVILYCVHALPCNITRDKIVSKRWNFTQISAKTQRLRQSKICLR